MTGDTACLSARRPTKQCLPHSLIYFTSNHAFACMKLVHASTLCHLFMPPLIWNLFIMPLPVWKLFITVTAPWHECTKLLLSVAATATFMMVALSWLNFISKDGEKIWYENEEQRVDVNILFHPLPFGLSCPFCQWGELERVPPPGFWQEMLELANHLFWQPQLTSTKGCPRLLPLSAIRLRLDNSYSYLACSGYRYMRLFHHLFHPQPGDLHGMAPPRP